MEKLRAQDQREIKRLQKELRKKEKALAIIGGLLLVIDQPCTGRRS